MGVKRTIFQDFIHFHFRPHPTVLTPDPGAMSFTIFVEGFMDIMTMHAFSFFPICVGAENKFFENLALVPPMTS